MNASEAAYRHLLETLSHTPAPEGWNDEFPDTIMVGITEISIPFYHNSDESQIFLELD